MIIFGREEKDLVLQASTRADEQADGNGRRGREARRAPGEHVHRPFRPPNSEVRAEAEAVWQTRRGSATEDLSRTLIRRRHQRPRRRGRQVEFGGAVQKRVLWNPVKQPVKRAALVCGCGRL